MKKGSIVIDEKDLLELCTDIEFTFRRLGEFPKEYGLGKLFRKVFKKVYGSEYPEYDPNFNQYEENDSSEEMELFREFLKSQGG